MADTTRRRPRVALLIPAERQAQVLTPEALARLRSIADVCGGDDRPTLVARLPELLAHADACVTGWYTPPIGSEALAGAPQLRLVAHCGGSVKSILPPETFARGIVVCHAANIIADAVAEATILAILLGLRRVHEMDRQLKAGGDARASGYEGRLLGALTVGLIGAGYVGRKLIPLVRAFGARVLIYDPYLAAAEAAGLGVEQVSLRELCAASDVISLHAPPTPETHRMVGRAELDLLRAGTVFINYADPWLVDETVLLELLRAGRIWAALDRFAPEPLALDSPYRRLENVLLSPHTAAAALDTHLRQGAAMVDEIERFFTGEPLRYRISPERFALMA
jgi:phosphoglycerate dehydrogenase-like enzyme